MIFRNPRVREPGERPFVFTASGRLVDLLNPTPEMIDIRDIAAHLAQLNRWLGSGTAPYSVAQHSVWCSRHCARGAEQHVFVHDFHEAYIGDISSPMKMAIAFQAFSGDPVADIAAGLDAAIHKRFGLPLPSPARAEAIRAVDGMAAATELRDLFPGDCGHWPAAILPQPHPTPIKPLAWSKAQDLFMARFAELFGQHATMAPR